MVIQLPKIEHNSAAATGEMNEAAQAVDTFKTAYKTSKGELPRVSEMLGWCPTCIDCHGRTEKEKKERQENHAFPARVC